MILVRGKLGRKFLAKTNRFRFRYRQNFLPCILETQQRYRLLGTTDRYAAILTLVLNVPAWLNGGKNLKIGPYSIACDQSDADSDNANEARCLSLSEMLDSVMGSNGADDDNTRFKSPDEIKQFAERINVRFTTDAGKRVTTLDIYIISARRFPSHYEAYRWPVDAKLAAPLLKAAFRELIADGGTPVK